MGSRRLGDQFTEEKRNTGEKKKGGKRTRKGEKRRLRRAVKGGGGDSGKKDEDGTNNQGRLDKSIRRKGKKRVGRLEGDTRNINNNGEGEGRTGGGFAGGT